MTLQTEPTQTQSRQKPLKKITPMMAQWHACKQKAKDAILFFRLGDFYEAFEEDARVASKELDITLTERQGTAMCGIPWHASQGYIDRLVAKGFKVAIVEQVEDAKKAKGLVAREVVRVITPATVVSSSLLQEKAHNFFASLYETNGCFGIALIDLTTASFYVFEHKDKREIINELFRKAPKELLLAKSFEQKHPELILELRLNSSLYITEQEKWVFEWHQAYDKLCRHFHVKTLDGFGLKSFGPSLQAAGGLLQYLTDSLLVCIEHISTITPHLVDDGMLLDRATLTNLEIIEPIDKNGAKNTLLSIIDETKTAMGARCLQMRLQKTLIDIDKILLRPPLL